MQPSRKTQRPGPQPLRIRVEPLEDRWLLDARGVVAVLPLATSAEALVRTPEPKAIVEQLTPLSSLNGIEHPSPSAKEMVVSVDVNTSPLKVNGDTQVPVSLANSLDSSSHSTLASRTLDVFSLNTNGRVQTPEVGSLTVRLSRSESVSAPVEPAPIGPPAESGSSLLRHRVLSPGNTPKFLFSGASALDLTGLANVGTNSLGGRLLFLLTLRDGHKPTLGMERTSNPQDETGVESQGVTEEISASPQVRASRNNETTLHFVVQSSETHATSRNLPGAHVVDIVGEKNVSLTSPVQERSPGAGAAVLAPTSSEDALRLPRTLSGELGGAGSGRGSEDHSESTPIATSTEVTSNSLPEEVGLARTISPVPEPPDAPKGAGLLTEFAPVNLHSLEVTLQMFGQQLQGSGQEPQGMLFWAGISCACLTAAAVAVGIAHRRQSALRWLLSERVPGNALSLFNSTDDLPTEDEV